MQFLIHLLPVSSGFHFYTHAFRSLLRIFCALPIVHDTSSMNAKLSSATTSFLWRHTNTCKNHGYNDVADDLRWQPFRAEDSAPAPYEEGQKGRKGQTCSDHTYRTVSSRPRGVQSLVQIGAEMWICVRYKLTNKLWALCIRLLTVTPIVNTSVSIYHPFGISFHQVYSSLCFTNCKLTKCFIAAFPNCFSQLCGSQLYRVLLW